MIEFFAGIAFAIGWIVMYFGSSLDFVIAGYMDIDMFLNALYKNLLIFLMFGRLYITILWNDTTPENKRIGRSLLTFLGCFACFGIELWASIIGSMIFGLAILLIGVGVFAGVKINTIKKYHKIFGGKYVLWHSIDALIIVAMFVLLASPLSVSTITPVFVGLLIALWLTNQHILFIQPLWATNQTFDDLIRFSIFNNDFDCLCEKMKIKKITDNIIYSECNTFLNYSCDRLKMIRKIVERVEKIFIEEGVDKKKITMMKRNMALNLVDNLMNRPLDYWRMIPHVRVMFQDFVRDRKRYGKKRIWLP